MNLEPVKAQIEKCTFSVLLEVAGTQLGECERAYPLKHSMTCDVVMTLQIRRFILDQ